jgi:hypothetical protein
MNFVYLSPHFPPNYYQFCTHLRNLGVNVLGVADEPRGLLRPELINALTEYFQITDLHDYDQLTRACGYFTYQYGKIDRIDSHNEYWLDTEARLREDFNIDGPKISDVLRMQRKSEMKKMFTKAGVNIARGKVVQTMRAAQKLINEIGYPVVAKPNRGVGAAKTYKIHNESELRQFFNTKPPVNYMMEEFITGKIYTFDGLTDRDGVPVFYTSHTYSQGIMETVNEDLLVYYYSLREIPQDLESAGLSVMKAYQLSERFFHFEFFRSDRDDQIIGLEVNMRPPGGLTTDMFNYANDIDIYREWANIIVHNSFSTSYHRPYHCCYISRKSNKRYIYSHDEILTAFGDQVVQFEPISGIFSAALGDFGYLVRSPNLEEIITIAEFVQKTE